MVCRKRAEKSMASTKKVGALNCMHDQQIILKGGDELNDVSEDEMIVRRLTPL